MTRKLTSSKFSKKIVGKTIFSYLSWSLPCSRHIHDLKKWGKDDHSKSSICVCVRACVRLSLSLNFIYQFALLILISVFFNNKKFHFLMNFLVILVAKLLIHWIKFTNFSIWKNRGKKEKEKKKLKLLLASPVISSNQSALLSLVLENWTDLDAPQNFVPSAHGARRTSQIQCTCKTNLENYYKHFLSFTNTTNKWQQRAKICTKFGGIFFFFCVPFFDVRKSKNLETSSSVLFFFFCFLTREISSETKVFLTLKLSILRVNS